QDTEVLRRVREIDRKTSEHPDAFVDAAFLAFPMLLDVAHATAAVDLELAHHGVSGRRLLDEWVPLATPTHVGPAHVVGNAFVSADFARQIQAHATMLR